MLPTPMLVMEAILVEVEVMDRRRRAEVKWQRLPAEAG